MEDIKVIYRIQDGEWIVDMSVAGRTLEMNVKEAQEITMRLYLALKDIKELEEEKKVKQ